MDKHIEAFRIVAKNYLDIDSHPLFGTIEELLMEVDIAECLMTDKSAGFDEDAT
jgi:chaperone BCS1